MLNRINQLGLIFAVVAFAGLGTAHAQDEDMDNPCGDGDNPCAVDDGMSDDDDDDDDGGGEATGDDDDDDGAADGGGGDAGDAGAGHHPGMVVPKGKISIHAALGVNLSADAVAKPIALAPDVIYGAIDKLDVGLYHSNYGIFGFWGQNGGGLCLTGEENGCGDLYNGPTGILVNYSISNDQLSIAAGGGLILSNVAGDTMLMDLKAGAKIRYMIDDKMGIQVDPSLVISLNERDPLKRDSLFVPAAFMYAVDAKIHAGVQTGIAGPLDGFGDAYIIPLAFGGMYQIDSKLGVGGAFTFENIAGNGSSADFRNLSVFGKYNL